MRSIVLAFMLGAATAAVCAGSALDTADWRLYRSESFAFEVRHPPTWRTQHSSGTMESIVLSEPSQAEKPARQVQFIVQRAINAKRLGIKQWYADQLKKAKSSPPSATDTTLAGRAAIRMEYTGTLGKHVTIFTRLNATDIFQVSITSLATESPLDPIYEAILASLRFTSSPVSAPARGRPADPRSG